MLYNRCKGIYKFGNNTYPRRIRGRSNLGHIFHEKKCILWARKYGNSFNWLGKKERSIGNAILTLYYLFAAALKHKNSETLLRPFHFYWIPHRRCFNLELI